jgi:DNA-binding transcriptional LysR family regulator
MALSVDDLRSFAFVAEERSASRAAVRLELTQQSVSERIIRLERRLGVDLFVRQPHGMTPTNAGYRLLPYAQRVLALMDEAMAALEGDDVVRVGVQRSSAPGVMPRVEELLDGFHLEVTYDGDARRVLGAVLDGVVDVGLGSFAALDESLFAAQDTEWQVGVVIERVFDDPVVCVARPDHALSERGVLHLADLTSAGLGLGAAMAEVAGLGAATSLTNGAREGGLALCARSTVVQDLDEGRLVQLDVVDLPVWVVPVHLAYRTSDRERPFIAALRGAHRHRAPDGDGDAGGQPHRGAQREVA